MRSHRSLVVVLALTACGDDNHPPDPRFDPLLEAAAADLATADATAASIAVWLDGEIIWVGGLGDRDPAVIGEPPDEDTQFAIGSDTKKLTAISLLRQVAAGRTSLEATVGELLPELDMQVAPEFTAATVRQLLSHQGGLIDGAEFTTATTDAALADFTYGELAATFPAHAPPGTFFNYSNPNFAIAGLIDQELDGRPWADIVEADVLAPLEMTRTVARRSEVDANHAEGFGHAPGADDPVHRIALADNWESAFVRPAGLVWSTPNDQLRLARFLVDGNPTVLDPALLQEITTPQVPMYPDLPIGYGFGLITAQGMTLSDGWHDVPVWWHGGNTRSYTSTFYVLPQQRFAISILSNGDEDDFTATVATAFSTLVDLPPPSTQPEVPFEPSELATLAGTYVDTIDGTEVTVTVVGDGLEISVPALDGQGIPYEHAMQPLSTHVWLAAIADQPFDFSFIDTPGGMYMRNREAVLLRR